MLTMPKKLPPAWENVLESVQLALKAAETAAAERETNLAFKSADEGEKREAAWRECMIRLATRSDVCQAAMQETERTVLAADAELQISEAAVRKWQTTLQTLGQDLAKWAGR